MLRRIAALVVAGTMMMSGVAWAADNNTNQPPLNPGPAADPSDAQVVVTNALIPVVLVVGGVAVGILYVAEGTGSGETSTTTTTTTTTTH